MINQSQIEKYYSFLVNLKQDLDCGRRINQNEFCRRNNITNLAFHFAWKAGLIKRVSIGVYEWNTIEPNRHMAKRLKKEVSDYHKKRASKNSTKKRKKETWTSTHYKYLSVLYSLYTQLQESDQIVMKDFSKKHKVGNNFIHTCVKLGIVEKPSKFTAIWVTRKPDLKMAKEVNENFTYSKIEPKPKPKQTKPVTLPTQEKKPTTKDQKPIEVSLFFGLIKLKMYK